MAMSRRKHHSKAAYAIILLGGLINGSHAVRFKKDVQSVASYGKPVQMVGGVSSDLEKFKLATINKNRWS